MILCIPKETAANERRVALVPDLLPKLTRAGLERNTANGHQVAIAFVKRVGFENRLLHCGTNLSRPYRAAQRKVQIGRWPTVLIIIKPVFLDAWEKYLKLSTQAW